MAMEIEPNLLAHVGRRLRALRVPVAALLEDQTDDASTGGNAPAEGYGLGDYL
ncbi:hypothetical protein [Rhodovulum steppense]|uniref:hypothetical protein n=1 Tax=Rhodovulum steppense TaxID=540251 RepID=UPI0014049858|nr:hypothetical protein [Rhodovulum steppense]